jgi:hypothetical protein
LSSELLGRDAQDFLEDSLACADVYVVFATIVEVTVASGKHLVEMSGGLAVRLHQANLFSVADVGCVLIFTRNPAIANQQTAYVPLVVILSLVAVHHCLRDVRDVLSCIRFTSNVDLHCR